MWALVESNSITKTFNRPKGFTLGDIQYPASIFTLWSKAEKEAIGLYEIIVDNSNLKDQAYYINGAESFTWDSSARTVTKAFASATAKAIADVTDDDGNVTRGLKYNAIQKVKAQQAGFLAQTDWYIIRKADAGTAIPSNIQTWRNAIRSDATAIETAITNATDMDAFIALHTDTYKTVDGKQVVDVVARINRWTELE